MFVSRDPHHCADNVGGNWHKSRQPVGRRTVSEHRRRRTVGRRSDIRYLPVEIASAESPGSATGAPSPPLPNPLLITRHRDAWSCPVSTRDLQKCFRFDRTKRCIVFNDPIQLSRAASVRDLLKRRSCPLARRLAERHSESYHPSEDRRTRQVISVIGAWASSKAVTTSSRREAITEASSPRESSSPNVELMNPSQRQDD